MTVYDIVSLNRELLKRLHKNGIKVTDYKWLDLYNDYLQMKADGYKTSYIVAKLSGKYKVCERQVFKVVKKMSQNCQRRARPMSSVRRTLKRHCATLMETHEVS